MANNQERKSDVLMPASQYTPHQIRKNMTVLILATTVVGVKVERSFAVRVMVKKSDVAS